MILSAKCDWNVITDLERMIIIGLQLSLTLLKVIDRAINSSGTSLKLKKYINLEQRPYQRYQENGNS